MTTNSTEMTEKIANNEVEAINLILLLYIIKGIRKSFDVNLP